MQAARSPRAELIFCTLITRIGPGGEKGRIDKFSIVESGIKAACTAFIKQEAST